MTVIDYVQQPEDRRRQQNQVVNVRSWEQRSFLIYITKSGFQGQAKDTL